MKKFYASNKGITLIALVISIIVMLILAGVSISAIVGEDGILSRAKEASISTRFAAYDEATQMALDSYLISAGDSLKNYIPNMTDEDLEKFAIVNGTLAYLGNNEEEKEIAERLGIVTDFGGNTTVEDLQVIQEKIMPLSSSETIPSDDTMPTPSGLIGQRLYDKNSLNTDRWRMIIDYNDLNQEKARYGSGYYLLIPGSYNINGETINLDGNYIVNYGENKLYGLSNNYVEWSLSSTLAVNEGLVLNIDPTNLADGNWAGIEKHGDVVYNADSKALLFNESEDNEKGEGGYLETTRSGIDFSNGFTFEMYGNFDRLAYDNGSGRAFSSIFCRIPYLNANHTQSLRFTLTTENCMNCKFNNISSWQGEAYNASTNQMYSGSSTFYGNPSLEIDTDSYFTFTYIVYSNDVSQDYKDKYYDKYMITNGVDKVMLYRDGHIYGYTYYGNDSYRTGCETWNNDGCPFFIGVAPNNGDGNLFYFKGKIYTTRLYTIPMTSEQVVDNRDMTMKYRASF